MSKSYVLVAAESLPERLKYHAGARYRLQHNIVTMPMGSTKKRVALMQEQLKTHALISDKDLRKRLDVDCSRSGAVHTCLNVFRENIAVVQNWRLLWRSLAAPLRREALIQMARESLRQHQESNAAGEWTMQYRVLGMNMCRQAFEIVTGIGFLMM